MEPSNDHERAIARMVERIAIEGSLTVSDGSKVMAALDFVMSKDDCRFLVRYIRWRMANPIPR